MLHRRREIRTSSYVRNIFFLAPKRLSTHQIKKGKNNNLNVSVINHFRRETWNCRIVRLFNLRKQKFLVNMAFNFRDCLRQAFAVPFSSLSIENVEQTKIWHFSSKTVGVSSCEMRDKNSFRPPSMKEEGETL